MKNLLILAIGAMFFVVFTIVALIGEKNEVYQVLLIFFGSLCAIVAIVATSKQQQIVALPPEAKKHPPRNFFGDEVDAEEDPETGSGQLQMLWAFFFLLAVAIILWVLGMVFYSKETAFLTVVTVVALIVRSCSESTLKEAGIKLEQGAD